MELHIIIHGNPVDGFSYIGPFPNSEAAVDHAENERLAGDWWIAPLEVPKED